MEILLGRDPPPNKSSRCTGARLAKIKKPNKKIVSLTETHSSRKNELCVSVIYNNIWTRFSHYFVT